MSIMRTKNWREIRANRPPNESSHGYRVERLPRNWRYEAIRDTILDYGMSREVAEDLSVRIAHALERRELDA